MKNRVIIVLIFVIVWHFVKLPSAFGQGVEGNLRKAAPVFPPTDSSAAPVRLSDYKGRVVLLNCWATWCHFCKTEIPWYIDFQKRYKGQGFTVGASMDDQGRKVVKPLIKAKQLNYPAVIACLDLAKQYGLGEMPLSILIDCDGQIADSHSGVVDRAAWESAIQHLLKRESEGSWSGLA